MNAEYEIIDPRFRGMVMGVCQLEKLFTGTRWAEGPVYFADGDYVLFSDIPNNRMMQYVPDAGVRVFRSPSNNSNGNTRDREGRLVTCEHGTRRVTRTELDGSITVLADRYEGNRLNSPNDVIVKSDGTIWFTDPPYGILTDYEGNKSPSELGANYVFRLDPVTKELRIVADDFDKPNGLAFSPDEKTLYIADSGNPKHIRAFDVGDDAKLKNGWVFAKIAPGWPDGFRLDTEGNLWTSAGDGVQCYTPKGELLGKIKVPEVVSNICFGGYKRNRMFITASTSLYAIYVAVSGAKRP